MSISYLGLTRERAGADDPSSAWLDWYDFFPWEDRRAGRGSDHAWMEAALDEWAATVPTAARARGQRCSIAFGFPPHPWNEEFVLQRYELLFEAGLLPEVGTRSGGPPPRRTMGGRSMSGDHRRILATGIARLRAKIKYRPVVFELMPSTFTLLQLQRTVEALAGRLLHKQNFRRLIEQQQIVEDTGAVATDTGGRPARLVRFRRDILDERAIAGTKLPLAGA